MESKEIKKIHELIGSQNRDYYRFLHKQEENYSSEDDYFRCKACDIDLVEVRDGKIIAFTDFKMGWDKVTPTEKVVYAQLKQIAPVFIITCKDKAFQKFNVESYPDAKYKNSFSSRKHFFREFIENIERISNTQKILNG